MVNSAAVTARYRASLSRPRLRRLASGGVAAVEDAVFTPCSSPIPPADFWAVPRSRGGSSPLARGLAKAATNAAITAASPLDRIDAVPKPAQRSVGPLRLPPSCAPAHPLRRPQHPRNCGTSAYHHRLTDRPSEAHPCPGRRALGGRTRRGRSTPSVEWIRPLCTRSLPDSGRLDFHQVGDPRG